MCTGADELKRGSTGQACKGAPNTGVFLQVTCDDPADIDVFGRSYSFAVEGFDILRNKDSKDLSEDERFELNMLDIAEVWRRGSVISSSLLDLGAAALARDPQLKGFSGFVQDSGEGRWTVEAAIEEAVPADVLSTALYARFRSREEHTFGEKLLSAMRFGFGGHIEGNEPMDPEPKPAALQGHSAARYAEE
jgi:6-phosphogluconate dehydrogenase